MYEITYKKRNYNRNKRFTKAKKRNFERKIDTKEKKFP